MKIIGATVHVTQKDIDDATEWRRHGGGLCDIAWNCPVARALKRRFKTENASSGWNEAIIDGCAYNMPDTVKRFVHAFDRRLEDVKPFTFKMEKWKAR